MQKIHEIEVSVINNIKMKCFESFDGAKTQGAKNISKFVVFIPFIELVLLVRIVVSASVADKIF